MDNPFFHRGIIETAEDLHGREAEVATVVARASGPGSGVWVEVTGAHRVGKSSVLVAVERALRARPEHVVGRVSAQATENTADLWRRVGRALGASPAGEPPKHGLEARLAGLAGKAVLLLDEAPVLAHEGRDPAVFDQLRGLTEEFGLVVISAAPARMGEWVRQRPGAAVSA